MPGPYGITATGFNIPSLDEIRTEMIAAAQSELGETIDVSDESLLGQLIGILADREADQWQLAQAVIQAAFPDGSTGILLERNAALTGTFPKSATSSVVSVTVTGTPGTIIPVDSRVAVPDVPDAVFEWLGPGSLTIGGGGTVTNAFTCVNTGPIPALAGTVTQIVTPVVGWDSVTNSLDQFVLGTDVETSTQLRLRRERELRAQGGSAFEAIRAAILKISGVTDAFVFENATDVTVDTIPPHAFETVVDGGDDTEIAETIFKYKPTAIATAGTSFENVLDSQGSAHEMRYTRPTDLNAYVTIDATVNAIAPANISTLIANAVVAYGDLNYRTGGTAYANALTPVVFATSAGIVNVDLPKIGLSASPTLNDPIVPTKRQIVDLDTSRIVVNITRI